MVLAFLIISLVIWTVSALMNFYTIAQQSKSSNISLITVIALVVNLIMVTLNILAMTCL